MATAAFRALTCKQATISHSLSDLPHNAANIVHIRRQNAYVAGTPSSLLCKPSMQVLIDVNQPEPASEYLLSAVLSPSLQQQLHHDVMQAVQEFSSVLQLQHVHAKVEVVTTQNCPRWHADSVTMRMLCTYAGPGTWFVANRYVTRHRSFWNGDVSIVSVDETHGQQALPGDLVFLKGNAFPGLSGAGAVHKSPELEEGQQRLLLTVDDACC